MLEQEEYQAVFSALDKHVNLETFKNIILDKCGDDDYSVKFGSNDNIEFSDQAKEKLRFLNNTSALIYSKKYDAVLLSNNIERDVDRKTEKETHIALGATNFIFFYEYGARQDGSNKAIVEMMNYLDIKNLDELKRLLADEDVNSDIINKVEYELKNTAPNEKNAISDEAIEQMCQSFLTTEDEEFKNLIEKIQPSIEPKFIFMCLRENDMIDDDEYNRLLYILDTTTDSEVNDLPIYLEYRAMLALKTMDNNFVLKQDDEVGYKLAGCLQTTNDGQVKEFGYLDLLNSLEFKKDEHLFKKAFVEILMNTDKSPYEILREAYTYTPAHFQQLSNDNSASSGTKTAGKTNNSGQTSKEPKDRQANQNSVVGLTSRERELFDDTLTYIRFKGNPFYFAFERYKENQQHIQAENQRILNSLPNTKVTRDIRKKMREIASVVNKAPQKAFDTRLYESAYQQKQRQHSAYINKTFEKISKQQIDMMWQTMGEKEYNLIEKMRNKYSKKVVDFLSTMGKIFVEVNFDRKNNGLTSNQTNTINTSLGSSNNINQENSYTKLK